MPVIAHSFPGCTWERMLVRSRLHASAPVSLRKWAWPQGLGCREGVCGAAQGAKELPAPPNARQSTLGRMDTPRPVHSEGAAGTNEDTPSATFTSSGDSSRSLGRA